MLVCMVHAQASPLPECRYDDIFTAKTSYGDWATTLLDTIYKLPENYVPPDLVSAGEAGLASGYEVRGLVIPDLKALVKAAKAAGHPLAVQSAYRSYSYQVKTFASWVAQEGRAQALKVSARPGHSEHQLGTVLDFRAAGGKPAWDYADWATTPTGKWLAANAYLYGFVMSYPKNKEALTCYSYEPWHYRYVGRAEAKAVHDSGLTLRQWLWRKAEEP